MQDISKIREKISLESFTDIFKSESLMTDIERGVLILIILISTAILAKIVSSVMNRFFKKSSLVLQNDPTKYRFLKHALVAIIYIGGVGFAGYYIPSLRAFSVTIFTSASILAVAIGFASQQAFSNIISGIFIVIFKPFRVNDRVKLNDNYNGIVEDITLRHVVIRNFENKRVVIPNSIISNEILINSNMSDDYIREFIDMGISYDSDVKLAIKIIREEAERHPEFIDLRSLEEIEANEPKVMVMLLNFGDSSVNLRAFVWAKDPPSAFKMHCELNLSIKERFDKEGIEIPFPHRTLVFKNPSQKLED